MSIGSRTAMLLLAGVLFLFACVPDKNSPSFAFSNHAIKLHYDPLSQELTAVDTLTLQYEKNVDRIYFFLHESLHVESVCVGHQEFAIGEMTESQAENMCHAFAQEWHDLIDQSQIVVVQIPKSLYSERIEIRYKGNVDLTSDQPVAWHPMLPGLNSSFQITSILPISYSLFADGIVLSEEQDDLWRLNRMAIDQKQTCCKIKVIQKSI